MLQVRRVSSSSTHGQDGSIYKFPLMGGPAINASMVLQGNARLTPLTIGCSPKPNWRASSVSPSRARARRPLQPQGAGLCPSRMIRLSVTPSRLTSKSRSFSNLNKNWSTSSLRQAPGALLSPLISLARTRLAPRRAGSISLRVGSGGFCALAARSARSTLCLSPISTT